MIVRDNSVKRCNVEAYLDSPQTCALYLNDALETCDTAAIAEVLRDIRRANGSTVRSLTGGPNMSLVEVMNILEGAGVRLVAMPVRATKT